MFLSNDHVISPFRANIGQWLLAHNTYQAQAILQHAKSALIDIPLTLVAYSFYSGNISRPRIPRSYSEKLNGIVETISEL